jgi:hypothetical protein
MLIIDGPLHVPSRPERQIVGQRLLDMVEKELSRERKKGSVTTENANDTELSPTLLLI